MCVCERENIVKNKKISVGAFDLTRDFDAIGQICAYCAPLFYIYIFCMWDLDFGESNFYYKKIEREREGNFTGLVWIILLKPYHCQITERNYLNKNANQGCVTFLFLFFEITVVKECYVHNIFKTYSK